MCSPMTAKTEDNIHEGVIKYAREWKQLEGKSAEQVEEEMERFENAPMTTLNKLSDLILDVRHHLDHIYSPIFVAQARNDEMIDLASPEIIINNVQSDQKELKWYENSSHVITFGPEKEQLHQDVHAFLESLDWTVE